MLFRQHRAEIHRSSPAESPLSELTSRCSLLGNTNWPIINQCGSKWQILPSWMTFCTGCLRCSWCNTSQVCNPWTIIRHGHLEMLSWLSNSKNGGEWRGFVKYKNPAWTSGIRAAYQYHTEHWKIHLINMSVYTLAEGKKPYAQRLVEMCIADFSTHRLPISSQRHQCPSPRSQRSRWTGPSSGYSTDWELGTFLPWENPRKVSTWCAIHARISTL